MNLTSLSIHLEIARVGSGFVVQYHTSHGTGSTGSGGTVYMPTRDALQAWLANMEIKV